MTGTLPGKSCTSEQWKPRPEMILIAGALEESLFHERFLLERPILKASAVVERGAVDR